MSVSSKLPNHWREAKFSDFVDSIVGGCSTQKSDYFREGVLVLNKGNIKTLGKIEFTKERVYVKPNYAAQHPKKIIRNGDLVATFRDLSAKADFLGLIGIFKEAEDALLTQGAYIVRLDQTVDPHFLVYYSNSPAYRGLMKKLKHGSTQVHIRNADFFGVPILLPPLPEQKKIAHILSTVQRAIEEQERIIQTTAELKKALMHKLFTEGLRNEPQKQTDIGPVPKSWEVVKLSSVCSFQSGGTPSKQNPEFWEGTIPWVSPKDMKRPRLTDVTDHISQEALESGSKLAPAGSVFVVVRGMILAKTVPVALAEVPMAINQDMKAIVPGNKLRSDFLLYALETLRGALFKKVGRAGHGTATLMSSEIANFKIPLPDLNTQHQVAAAIHTLETKKELHEQKLAHLQNLFRTLLHDLMTAKVRVSTGPL